ncbi:MAG: energy transducer TonB [Thermoanaerobaculia bacterium]
MEGRTNCVRCGRDIDALARLCPFCNWEQSETPPPAPVREETVATPPPPSPAVAVVEKVRERVSGRTLTIMAIVALLLATFAVGGLVLSFSSRHDRLLQKAEAQAEREGVAPVQKENGFEDLTLVPVTDPTATIGRSVTSTPIPDPDHQFDTAYDRRDATALPSEEYSQPLQTAPREMQRPYEPVDPRSVAGNVHQPQPGVGRPAPVPVRRPSQETRTAERTNERRTNPVPIKQPLPDFSDAENSGTVSFNLTIGADGRVKGVDVLKSMPGMTTKMIAALHRWRFKPATADGEPVEGTFRVDISFNADE